MDHHTRKPSQTFISVGSRVTFYTAFFLFFARMSGQTQPADLQNRALVSDNLCWIFHNPNFISSYARIIRVVLEGGKKLEHDNITYLRCSEKEIASCEALRSCCTRRRIDRNAPPSVFRPPFLIVHCASAPRAAAEAGDPRQGWNPVHIKSILAFGVGEAAGSEGRGEHMSDTSWLFHEVAFEVLNPHRGFLGRWI